MTIEEAFNELQLRESARAGAPGSATYALVYGGWRKALDYHQRSPEIYEAFCDFTQEAIDANWEHYGSMDIIGRIRWHTHIEKKDRGFKIVNAMHPYYARVWMVLHPKYEGFFRVQDKPLRGMA
jgi:hypothetical protein